VLAHALQDHDLVRLDEQRADVAVLRLRHRADAAAHAPAVGYRLDEPLLSQR
jgi:hypothetical protein